MTTAAGLREMPDKPVGLGKSLRTACGKGDWDEVKTLLDNGADYGDGYEKDGSSPFLLAAERGRLQVVEGLWTHLRQPAILNEANDRGATPLHVACENGHLAVVRYLILIGANVNQVCGKKQTPLFTACKKGFVDIVMALVGADADARLRNYKGRTPLRVAAEKRHFQIHDLVERHLEAQVLMARFAGLETAMCSGQASTYFIAATRGSLESQILLPRPEISRPKPFALIACSRSLSSAFQKTRVFTRAPAHLSFLFRSRLLFLILMVSTSFACWHRCLNDSNMNTFLGFCLLSRHSWCSVGVPFTLTAY